MMRCHQPFVNLHRKIPLGKATRLDEPGQPGHPVGHVRRNTKCYKLLHSESADLVTPEAEVVVVKW